MDNFIPKAAETVTIKQDRYEQLLDTETRVDVAVNMICDSDFLRTEDILRILGTDRAIERADELKKADEERHKKIFESMGCDEELDSMYYTE